MSASTNVSAQKRRPVGASDRAWRIMAGILALCAVSSALLMVLLIYPFNPYRVYETRVVPPVICSGQEVRVEGDSQIESGWRLYRVQTESVWEPAESASADLVPVSGGTGTIYEPQARERGIVVSKIIRTAPDSPGEYRLRTEAAVYGTFDSGPFSGFPKVQRLEYTSNYVTVVKAGENCGGAE